MTIDQAVLSVIGTICMSDSEQLKDALERLESLVDTGYYDGDGDAVLRAVIDMIKTKMR